MNDKKVAFVFIEGISGLPDPATDFTVLVKLHPRGESSPGKIIISDNKEPKCQTTWPLIYHSEIDEFVSITLNFKNNEYAKLLLPLKWFEANKIVKETFPMRITDQKAINDKINVMMTILIHRSENGECAFIAPQGQLLVKPQWNANQTKNTNNDASLPTSNNQQQYPQQQPMVFLNPGQSYMVPISGPGGNQILIPMQIQGQYLAQAPYAPNPYQYPIHQVSYPQNGQYQLHPTDQNSVQNLGTQENTQENVISGQNNIQIKLEESNNDLEKVEVNNPNSQSIDEHNQESQEENQAVSRSVNAIDQNEQEFDQNVHGDKKETQKSDENAIDANQNVTKSTKKSKKVDPKIQEENQKLKKSEQKVKNPEQNGQVAEKNSNKTPKKTKSALTTKKVDQSLQETTQPSQASDQNTKKARQNQSSKKVDKDDQKVDQSTKNAKTKNAPPPDQIQHEQSESEVIPVLQPMKVYIKAPEGKLKLMLLMPSTKNSPAKLVPVPKKKQ